MTTARGRAMCVMVAISIAAVSACSSADDNAPSASAVASSTTLPAVPAGGLTISGAVQHPGARTAEQLRGYPAQTQAVTFDSSKGAQSHTYQGPLLPT